MPLAGRFVMEGAVGVSVVNDFEFVAQAVPATLTA
jgi:hypothetical protein